MSTDTETKKETITWGFGKPFVRPLTYSQLLRIEREFEIPQNQKEQLVLDGAHYELFHTSGFKDDLLDQLCDLKEENESLEEQLLDTTEVDTLRKELEELSKPKNNTLDAKLEELLAV